MKKAKIGKKLAALVLVLATMMAFAITAYGFETTPEYYSGNYNGISFQYKVYYNFYEDGPHNFRGSVWVEVTNQTYLPAGWMQVQAAIVNPTTGLALADTGLLRNDTPNYYMYAVTDHCYPSQTVYGRGEYILFTGTNYKPGVIRTDPVTPTRSINESLLSTLDANGNYPTTDAGETYGSILLADVVGYEPDLVAAQGIDGIVGYYRNEDLNPTIYTMSDYKNYRSALEANEWKIPLYDLQGNVIEERINEIAFCYSIPGNHLNIRPWRFCGADVRAHI